MKQKLIKHCALMLLAVFATAWSSNAWALTINVKASQAPYVYAWDNDQNPLLDPYPGTQLTNVKKVGNETWYYIDIDASTANIILSFGSDATKTGDIYVNGNRYFEFANNNANNVTDYYDLPEGVEFEPNSFCYAVNTNGWGTMYAYVYDSSNNTNHSWPGEQMTKVGTNGNGNDVYKWTGNTPANPATVIFNNNSGDQTGNLQWTNGAYWSVYGGDSRMTISGVILNSTNFPDPNFRSAVSTITGKSEGQAITTNNQKVLHIENKGISNLAGIEFFTNLEELYAGGNDISNNVILTSNPNLRILDMNGNSQLQGVSSVHTPYIDVTKCKNLEEINFANTGCTWMGGLQHIDGDGTYSNLKKLNLHNVGLDYMSATTMQKMPNLEWIDLSENQLTDNQGFSNNTKLQYIDVSDNPQNAKSFVLVALTQLKTFKAANCNLKASQTVYNSASNFFPTESVEYVDLSGNTALTTMYCPATNNLKTLIVNGCTGLQGSSSAGALGGSTTYISRMTHLEHLELNNVDLYLHTGAANGLFTILTPSVAPNLRYIDLSNDLLGSASKPTFAFPKLDTLLINGNPSLTELTVKDLVSPDNFLLNVTNDAALTTIAINNCNLTTIPTITATGAASLYKLDLTDNAFTSVPTTGISSLTTLVMNNNLLSNINVSESNIKYLYAQNNNFGSGAYTLPPTSLVGLDLGNNGFTKFKAENNASLKSLALGGNTDLTEIELHNNESLTQTSPDGVIESDNGLYIKGLGNLVKLNIANSSFNKLGQQRSLQGLNKLDTLQARNNHFTTFTNGVNTLNYWNTNSKNIRIPDPNESTLEDLPELKYLDLSYNNLQDSVHLYCNTKLRHLDVSHNRTITGIYTNPNMTQAEKTAMLEKKGYHFMKYGNVYQVQATNPTEEDWLNGYTNFQAQRSRPFDLRIEDLNDTTGLYHLDLGMNTELEWLDFSYTNIHNTAAGPEYMNPGWIDRDWVTDMGSWQAKSASNTINKRVYATWHTFIYFIPCSKLKVIHADHNNMCSMGIRYFPELDTLTCSYMYGDCAMMRDFSTLGHSAISDADLKYGMGNTGLSTQVQRLKSITWGTNSTTGEPKATLTFEGPDESHIYFQNPLKYWDISYSGFNEIRLYKTSGYDDLPNLEYVDVSGNPLNFTAHAANANYATTSNWNSLDVTYCPNIRTVKAENCSDLPIVRAYNLTNLDTLTLDNDPLLKNVYIQNNPAMNHFTGLSTLTGLETLFAYNNTQFGGIDVSNNAALKNLWVSNIYASSIDVSQNYALEKLRVYDNSLTSLNVASNPALTWLDFARNSIEDIDLRNNTALQYFNCSNSEETLNDLSLTQNNHNGAEGDSEKPASGTAKASNGGNNLSDLVFPGTAIADVRANYNDLHCIKPGTSGSFANLTNIEFAHNHINGIDLSAATNLNADKIVDDDNGRPITAECAKFIKHGTNQEVTVYYFQLDNIRNQQLAGKTSKDSKGTSRVLGRDGFILDNLTAWDGTNAAPYVPQTTSGIRPKDVTVDPSNMSQYLDGNVEGSVVVLKEDPINPAEGRATYTYNNGKSNSTFYLDWSSDGTVTAINEIDMPEGLTVAGSYGALTINGADGTVVGVYDMAGREVATETISGGTATITGLNPGVYVVNGSKVVVK